MKHTFFSLLAALPVAVATVTSAAGYAADFPVADFGGTGDGKTDDGPAIQRAVDAAVAAGPGSRVVFENKTYRLDRHPSVDCQISLNGAKDITIEGNGALLINHPNNNLFSLTNCSGVSVKGFTVDYDPLPFTQGTITKVNPTEGWIDVRIHEGYRHPVDEYESAGKKPRGNDWGVVFDPVGRHRRWGIPSFFVMDGFARSPSGKDVVRIMFPGKGLETISPGDRYVLSFKLYNQGANNQLSGCGNCLFEDFTIYAAKYGMTFKMTESSAQNIFRRVKMTFKPGSDRLFSVPKDGFHCKGNRVGPLIEECHFEGLLDDSINISTHPYWIKKVISPGIYAMSGKPAVGDHLTAHTASKNEVVEGFVVKSVKPWTNTKKDWHVVELDREIQNPVVNNTNNDSPIGEEKSVFTGMYNVDNVGNNYVIRNCTFLEQRRHAMLIRASGGIIEGNTIDGVGGTGIALPALGNGGHFHEGPVPHNTTIRNNVIRKTQGVPVCVGSNGAKSPDAYTKNIRITDNTIESCSAICIQAFCVDGLEISRNKLSYPSSGPKADGLMLINNLNQTIAGNSKP